jgi:hypothetical protein
LITSEIGPSSIPSASGPKCQLLNKERTPGPTWTSSKYYPSKMSILGTRLSSAFMLLLVALLALPTNAVYFFMKSGEVKCFYEELPKDTLVVGK